MNHISNVLDPIGWVLLFLGWLMYWLKNLNQAKKDSKGNPQWFSLFINDNLFEIPVSVVSCLVLALLADSIPPDIMDMKGKLSILIVGYSASSILNGLITNFKKS